VSIQSQIEALETLATIDAELALLEAALQAETGDLGEKRAQLSELDAKLGAAQNAIAGMENTRNSLITEARQMSLQMDRSRDKLNRCRSEREVNAAQREVEELRKLYRDREIEIQKLGDLIEQARQDVDGTLRQKTELSTELGDSAVEVQGRLAELQAEAAEKQGRRMLASKAVPPALFRKYEMIRLRKGSGLCYTTTGTCSSCHISLSPMAFQILRRGLAFDQCPSCNRILYFRAEPLPSDLQPQLEGNAAG
jgi:predicted  nucleic acid-binding Zn-ribbon protein